MGQVYNKFGPYIFTFYVYESKEKSMVRLDFSKKYQWLAKISPKNRHNIPYKACFVLILVLKHEKYQYFFENPKFDNIENKHG